MSPGHGPAESGSNPDASFSPAVAAIAAQPTAAAAAAASTATVAAEAPVAAAASAPAAAPPAPAASRSVGLTHQWKAPAWHAPRRQAPSESGWSQQASPVRQSTCCVYHRVSTRWAGG